MIKPRVLVGPLEMSLSSQGSIVEILSNTMLRLGRFVMNPCIVWEDENIAF